MASLHFDGVHKAYGDVQVLHRVDVDVNDGEFLVLVGPSGCGKSTLLRCIAGLETISGGTLRIGDRVVNDVAPRDRDVAMVFQSYALYPHMTVRENMGFALKLRKDPQVEIDRAVDEAAAVLELEALLDRYPKEMSGGQRQRVAMGRAIVRRPKVFLFDEPLSNLDAALRAHMRVELKRLHQALGTTMVYVTHDQVEAMTLADRIAVLNAGHLQQVGTPAELYDDPANRFVAGFIGSPAMSFLERLDPDAVVGVRPHEVRLGPDIVPAQGGVHPCTIEVVETLGFESFVHLRIGDETLVARVEGPPPSRGPADVQLGQVYRFDPESGDRIR
ncbi:MAG: sn-glycerol-3-phosphate ABC transporter ATP-binding protein UgpC [Myxococcota bacterium]|nr:sn-glycerol-3-phosphate ABC transporter ATP-binding protein UgpC [Myxococcota bacterium]